MALPTQQPDFDPGLTQQAEPNLTRAVNRDGTFNVRRTGAGWRAWHPWLQVISMKWGPFMLFVVALYLFVNTAFALVYFSMPASEIRGTAAPTGFGRFLNDFFFSAHTLTTVGYGSLVPDGIPGNVVAVIEALVGLMVFAIITGVLIARVSRPSARIGYSPNALISPYRGGRGLMFRIVNERPHNLLDLEAQVLLMTVESANGRAERRFQLLNLERQRIGFFPLPWTIVHPVDSESPLYGKTAEDMANREMEIIVLLKAFDELFSQPVQSRYSYRYDEIVWGARFSPSFHVDEKGSLIAEINRLGKYELVELPPEISAIPKQTSVVPA
jgi:inward rectifier potassium channel